MKKLIACLMAVAACAGVLGPCFPVCAQEVSSSAVQSQSSAMPSAPQISAESAVVMDAANGAVLYGKDIHKKMYPASITKILTGYLTVKNGHPGDIVTVSKDALVNVRSDTTNIALTPGEQLSEEQALYATFLASANDAAAALAEHTGGTISNFVDMMNRQAKQWGAKDSHFNNANGLPDPNHYTSAYDMALITENAVKLPELLKYFGAVSYTIPPTNNQPKSRPIQTHCIMLCKGKCYYSGIIAAKSGWTTSSGSTLVTAAQRDGVTLVCVLLKGPNNVGENAKLLDYAFANYAALSAAPVVPALVSSSSALTSKTEAPPFAVKSVQPAVTKNTGGTVPVDKVILLSVILSVFAFCFVIVIFHQIRLRQ